MKKFYNTIAFRLTLWFTGIFSICAAVAFSLFYFLSVRAIMDQVDQDLLDSASKFTAAIHRSGLAGARELAVIEAQASGEKLIFFRLLYPTGEVFASSHMSYWKNVGISKTALRTMMVEKTNVFETITIPDTDQKARLLYYHIATNAILQTGISMENSTRFLTAFKTTFLGVMGFILILSAVSGWLLVQKALSGVRAISRTAQNISAANLEDRVQTSHKKDELDELADTFNLMLDRIEELVRNTREMNDNIAHDLKSPITRIRGFAELALVHEDSIENYRSMAATTIEESDRLLDMINTMLLISKAEAGEGDFNFMPCDVSKMVQEACELFAPLAEDQQLSLEVLTQPGIMVHADLKMLQRAFSNLLDNAIKYTPKKGTITVSVKSSGNYAFIRVADTGIGIDPRYFEKIFDRFYRTETSRTTSGTGLGLSLARTIIQKHGGRISVQSTPGRGSQFEITLALQKP